MIQLPKILRVLVLGAASASLLAACSSSDDSFDDRVGLADPKVRFVHAVPGAPNVTLQRNGTDEASAANVAYKSASQYYDVSTENYAFTLLTKPGDVELTKTAVTTERGNKYTLIALPSTSGVELLTVRDPFNKSLAGEDARFRVLHAAANAQAFDVYLTAVGTDLTTVQPRVASLAYKQLSPGNGENSVEVPAATYQLILTPSGSKTPFFRSTVTAPKNGDWLLVALPDDVKADAIRVLLVRSDDSADATDEIVTE